MISQIQRGLTRHRSIQSLADTPMDVNSREQVVSLKTVLLSPPLTMAQHTDPYDSSHRQMLSSRDQVISRARVSSSRRRLCFQRVQEVFPNADDCNL
jgi:hypothetical protein